MRFFYDDPAFPGEDQHAAAVRGISELEDATERALKVGAANPQLLVDEQAFPGLPAWMALRKHAIALHPLYAAPWLDRLGVQLTVDDLTRPLFDGATAFDVLGRVAGDARAKSLRRAYERFLHTPYTDALRTFISSAADARGIRWRAAAAAQLASRHARQWESGRVDVLSLACGAAGPMATLVAGLRSVGVELHRLRLLDHDPVALAAGLSVAGLQLPSENLEAVLFDLVDLRSRQARSLARVVGDHPVRLVDILGLFEYLPDDLAVDLLVRARAVLATDGAVVLGNMLESRPQQTFFQHVIQWPSVIQRSVADVLTLAGRAGFDVERASVLLPPEGDEVYAVMLLRR